MKKWMLMSTLISGAAFAESQPRPPPELFPADGATNVPLNAIPRGVHVEGREVWLFKVSGGSETPVTLEAREDQLLTNFVPAEPLQPNTEYLLVLNDLRHRFTTGDARDEIAPTTPGVTVDEPWTADWRLNFETVPERGTLALVRSGERLVCVASSEAQTLRNRCRGFSVRAGEAFDVDVQLMDLAGNTSDTAPVRVVGANSGCSTTPAGASLLLAVAAFLRRRRAK